MHFRILWKEIFQRVTVELYSVNSTHGKIFKWKPRLDGVFYNDRGLLFENRGMSKETALNRG
jgi:hypothetical protein